MIAELISRAFSPRAETSGTRDPLSNFWYNPVGTTADDALTISTVFACIRVRSNTVGAMPWHIYRDQPDAAKKKATEHPWYPTLHTKPNESQTPKQLKTLAMTHVDVRGNFYAEVQPPSVILPTPRLRPLDPDRMTVKQLENGRKQYEYREENGPKRDMTQDQVYHVMGPSFDGLVGVTPFTYARTLTTLVATQQSHAQKTFDKGGAPRFYIESDKPMNDEKYKAFTERWKGIQQDGNLNVLDDGTKIVTLGLSMVDAQWLESQQWTGRQFCQFMGTPPHLVFLDSDSKANMEQKGREWLAFHLNPILVEFEQSIQPWIGPGYFSQFNRDAIVRAETKARYESHGLALAGRAWKTIDEVRELEDLAPKGGEAAELPPPPNQSIPAKNVPQKFNQRAEPGNEDDDEDEEARGPDLRPLIADAAARIVAAECRGLERLAEKANGSPQQFTKWAAEFYGRHGDYIGKVLAPLESATGCEVDGDAMCVAAMNELSGRDVPHLLAEWKTDKPSRLAAELEAILCPNNTTP